MIKRIRLFTLILMERLIDHHRYTFSDNYGRVGKWTHTRYICQDTRGIFKGRWLIAPPAKDDVYQHRESGALYTVITVSNLYATRWFGWPATVVYRDHSGLIWSRPLWMWHHAMASTGNQRQNTGSFDTCSSA